MIPIPGKDPRHRVSGLRQLGGGRALAGWPWPGLGGLWAAQKSAGPVPELSMPVPRKPDPRAPTTLAEGQRCFSVQLPDLPRHLDSNCARDKWKRRELRPCSWREGGSCPWERRARPTWTRFRCHCPCHWNLPEPRALPLGAPTA